MGICARIAKRIITLLIVILGVVTLSFCLQIFTGTDPAEMLVRKTTLFATEDQIQAMRVELGLDGTLSEQYADYIKGLLTGDLGISITNRKPVIDNIRDALPVTCMLVIMSMLWVAILTVLLSSYFSDYYILSIFNEGFYNKRLLAYINSNGPLKLFSFSFQMKFHVLELLFLPS